MSPPLDMPHDTTDTTGRFASLDEPALELLAEQIAFLCKPGTVITLTGDLGAGKTTFARAFVRAAIGNRDEEVPSPTYTLVQIYGSGRFPIAHYDLYRLSDAQELAELGLDHAVDAGAALIEWPDRAGDDLPAERLDITFTDSDGGTRRNVVVTGTGAAAVIATRLTALRQVMSDAAFSGPGTRVDYLQGDASARRYARISKADGTTALVMDWPRQPDGPPIRDGLPYSQIAHLAEDVAPFITVDEMLRDAGFSAPELLAVNRQTGFLVLEDLGNLVFGDAVLAGGPQDPLWRNATDVLIALRKLDPGAVAPLAALPSYDTRALSIETELVVDWAWPALHGSNTPDALRETFSTAWSPLFVELETCRPGLVLRDFHSPNLIHLPEREGVRSVGLIDFQDAMRGPFAYDLVSLLQDARIDVPRELEDDLLTYYCRAASAAEPDFDESAFRLSYAILGAQRNSKILGIFVRLAKRDGKPQYLSHLPRIWGYLDRNLAHPRLSALKSWYETAFPDGARSRLQAL